MARPRLRESEAWGSGGQVVAGGKYFYTRNQSTLVAFVVGGAYKPGGGFKVVGAHTDSPVLKVKPVSKKSDKASGLIQLGAECYGGGLWHTWFDRDLTVAGSVIVKTAEGGGFERRLLHCKKPILRVPNLAIHLQTPAERQTFTINKETHLTPILGIDLAILAEEQLNGDAAPADDRHSPAFLTLIAKELGCAVGDIQDFDLTLCDTQPAACWGMNDEFVSSPRTDNQVHCFTAMEALISHAASAELATDTDVAMIALFDHEEVGSESFSGACSPVMGEAISRVCGCFTAEPELAMVALQKSFLVSADVAHALHPNYVSAAAPSAPSSNLRSCCTGRQARVQPPAQAERRHGAEDQRQPALRDARRDGLCRARDRAARGHPRPGVRRAQRLPVRDDDRPHHRRARRAAHRRRRHPEPQHALHPVRAHAVARHGSVACLASFVYGVGGAARR